MSHVFVSYSSRNIGFARYVRVTMEGNGLEVWMDEKRLSASMIWSDEVQKAIDTCAAFVVIMSPDANSSKFVQSEVLHAMDLRKPVFPILFVGEPFFFLKSYQYEDMRGGLGDSLSAEFLREVKQQAGMDISTHTQTTHTTRLEIVNANVLTFPCDAVVLKYAQSFHGADRQVVRQLSGSDISIDEDTLKAGEHLLVPSEGAMNADLVLFVPTPAWHLFSYGDIRAFTLQAFTTLAEEGTCAKHVAFTIHGMGFGLDEHEASMAQIGGILDMLQDSTRGTTVERISIVEKVAPRALRLQEAVSDYFNGVPYARHASDSEWGYDLSFLHEDLFEMPNAGKEDVKPYGLVILPEDGELDDIFHFGIERPIRAMGQLCETLKLDETGDSVEGGEPAVAALERIEKATLVVCEASQISPSLMFKLGFAFGKSIPTVAVTRDNDHPFAQVPCIAYKKIGDLEEELASWLKATMPC